MTCECVGCGRRLTGANYTPKWTEGNEYGYWTCPDCGAETTDYDDDDD